MHTPPATATRAAASASAAAPPAESVASPTTVRHEAWPGAWRAGTSRGTARGVPQGIKLGRAQHRTASWRKASILRNAYAAMASSSVARARVSPSLSAASLSSLAHEHELRVL